MAKKYSGFLASTSDPSGQTLSLTVESLSKVAIGVVAFYATSHGFDPATATNYVQLVIDGLLQAIPAGYALFHTLQGVWGAVRKLYALFATTE